MDNAHLNSELQTARRKYRAACDVYDAEGLAPSRKAIIARALAQQALEAAERALREAADDAA